MLLSASFSSTSTRRPFGSTASWSISPLRSEFHSRISHLRGVAFGSVGKLFFRVSKPGLGFRGQNEAGFEQDLPIEGDPWINHARPSKLQLALALHPLVANSDPVEVCMQSLREFTRIARTP